MRGYNQIANRRCKMSQAEFSHGFLPNCIQHDILSGISNDVRLFLQKNNKPTYYSGMHTRLPSLVRIITPNLMKYISARLQCTTLSLENVELHHLPAESEPIPPHQDNFYHCIEDGAGLKILVPLSDFSASSGALIFLNCTSSIGVLEHLPSRVKNFSSYIPMDVVDSLRLTQTSYAYRLGDASYHMLNSIHYSLGNRTKVDKTFLVYRFQRSASVQSPILLAKYQECYSKHVELVQEWCSSENGS